MVFCHRCLEEGAQEFFLKPVRLSDVDRLRPYLSKNERKTTDDDHDDDHNDGGDDDVEGWSDEEEQGQTVSMDQSC